MASIEMQTRALERDIREWEGAVAEHKRRDELVREYDRDSLSRKVYMSAEQWRQAQESSSRRHAEAMTYWQRANAVRYEILRRWKPYFESVTFPDIRAAIQFAKVVDKLDRSAASGIVRRVGQTTLRTVHDYNTLIACLEAKGDTSAAIETARQGWKQLGQASLRRKLAGLLERKGTSSELIGMLKEDMEADPAARDRARQKIVEQHLRARQVKSAVSFLDSEVAKFPGDKALLASRQNLLVDAFLGTDDALSKAIMEYLRAHPDERVERDLVQRFSMLHDQKRRHQILEMIVRTKGSGATPYLWEALAGGDRQTVSYALANLGGEDSPDPAATFAKRLFKEKPASERKGIVQGLERAAGWSRESRLGRVLKITLMVALTVAIGSVMAVAASQGLARGPFEGRPATLDVGLLSQVHALYCPTGPIINPSESLVLRYGLVDNLSTIDPCLLVGVLPFLLGYVLNLACLPLGRKLGVIGCALASLASAAAAIVISCTLFGVLGVGVIPLDVWRQSRFVVDFYSADQAVASAFGLWPLVVPGCVLGAGAAWILIWSREFFPRRRVADVVRAITG